VQPFPTAIIPLGSDDAFFGRWFSSPQGDLDPLDRPVAENEITGWRLFTGVDIDVTESFTLHAELGYTEEEKEDRFIEWDEADLTNPAPLVDISGKETFEQWTGRVGADWKFTDEWMTYFSIAKGEKPGGFTVFNATATDPGTGNTIPIAEQVPFDPEEIIAYELGVKGTAFDRRLRVDLSTFINDWTDIVLRQTTDTDPTTGLPLDQPQAVNVNSADSTVWGFELDTSVFFTDNLSGRVAVGYTNAEIDNAVLETVAEFPSFAPDGDVSGNELLRQPEWTASASLGYEHALVADWDWYTRADVSWQDEVFVGLDNQSYLPDRTVANFKFGVRNEQLSLEFWVRNLFDDDSPTAAYRDVFFNNTDQGAAPFPAGPVSSDFFDIFPFRYTVSHPRLRTWGVTARVRFGASAK
jgi:iron complex outermembrane receptor protein